MFVARLPVLGSVGLVIAITSMQLLPRRAQAQILWFEDVTADSGLDVSAVTHSVAWGDFNDDGCPDLWISKHTATLGGGQPANLYQNLCNGHFSDVTTETVTDLNWESADFHGAAWGDFDNDGDVDLMQLNGGDQGVVDNGVTLRARLFVNSGGTLVDQAAEFGIAYPLGRGRMPLWFDYDNDGKLDQFFGAENRPDGVAPPTIFHQSDHVFEDARSTTGFNLKSSPFALISDLNADRRMELIAISPQPVPGTSDLRWRLNIFDIRGLPFVDQTAKFLPASPIRDDFSDIAIADFNNDLMPDIYITRRTGPNQLLINNGSFFVDRTAAAGISGIKIAGNAVVAADFDNDGDQDMYIDQSDGRDNGPNVLLENMGDGTFVATYDIGGPTDTLIGRGGSMAVADYDNDGFLDIVVTNGQFIAEPPVGSDVKAQLLHNRGNANHWLKLKLIGSSSNRDGVGASVIITTSGISQLREAGNGVHRFAQDDTVSHFGVAGATVIDEVMVRWPSGRDTIINNVAVDQVLSIREPPS